MAPTDREADRSIDEPQTIPIAPSPWTLKATIYLFSFYISSSQQLPLWAYSPLESKSSFASGKSCGGLSMVQIIRYLDSPAGPYDEMLVTPGKFEYEVEEGGKKIKKRNTRVTRIYVSQKVTCYNGRLHWNIPKHLARFSFTALPSGAIKIEVFPHDLTSDVSEASPSVRPFFTATYSPVSYLPYFPLSTSIMRYVGMDINLVQPPLPAGKGKEGELPGTKRWCKLLPVEYSKKASLGWFDIRQPANAEYSDDASSDAVKEVYVEGTCSTAENWWPGLGRWQLGMKMDDATVLFGGETLWEA
ncbi:MAG: hypothetical protein MMC33_004002 [Icmadophila ericetorum]|nr:hypothetical protein [Icmadophila ericetorum]